MSCFITGLNALTQIRKRWVFVKHKENTLECTNEYLRLEHDDWKHQMCLTISQVPEKCHLKINAVMFGGVSKLFV